MLTMENVLGQGRENAKQFLKENPAIKAEIAQKIRESLGMAARCVNDCST